MSVQIWAAVITAISGIIVYAIKKYVDIKVDSKLDVLKKKHLSHYEIIIKIEGMLVEINHCIIHIKHGDIQYTKDCKEWCTKLRQESRLSVAYIGKDILDKITMATDIAIQYSDQSSNDLYNIWETSYRHVYDCVNSSIKNL